MSTHQDEIDMADVDETWEQQEVAVLLPDPISAEWRLAQCDECGECYAVIVEAVDDTVITSWLTCPYCASEDEQLSTRIEMASQPMADALRARVLERIAHYVDQALRRGLVLPPALRAMLESDLVRAGIRKGG